MTYPESIDWLYSTQLFGMKLGLERPKRLLREFLAYPPPRTRVIHVAGTNGKGSTCALIDSVARAAGLRTGLFTSPHLVHYGERIQVSGTKIEEDEIARHLTALRRHVADWDPHPTFFELTLALAMTHFAASHCELLILETGMGGRLDATSAVPADLAVLTPVALDHQQWLGDTLAEIAAEKAAIIRPGKPALSSPQEAAARTVIAQTANEQRAPLEWIEEPLRGYGIGIAGDHQSLNAALAVTALHAIGVPLNYDVVRTGLANVRWPGRFEILPAPSADPSGPDLVLDVAHNPAAAKALAANWRRRFPSTKARLIFGNLSTKDTAGILDHLLPLAAEALLVPINSPRSIPPDDLLELLPAGHPPVCTCDTVIDALKRPSRHPTLVTGSAFLVGEVKAILERAHHMASSQ